MLNMVIGFFQLSEYLIKTSSVVLFMQENRAFDHVCLSDVPTLIKY